MENYSIGTIIIGSKRLYNKMMNYLDIANRLPTFSPKRTGLYILAGGLCILYLASAPIFGPINYIRGTFARACSRVFGVKFLTSK